MRVLLFLQVLLHEGVQRNDPAVPQLTIEVHLLLLHFRGGLHHLQRGVVVVAILHGLHLLGQAIKDQGHMSIIKPGDIRVDVLGISKIKQQGGRWGMRRVGEKKKIK